MFWDPFEDLERSECYGLVAKRMYDESVCKEIEDPEEYIKGAWTVSDCQWNVRANTGKWCVVNGVCEKDLREDEENCPEDCLIEPTCFDRIQNQGEEGIDCGGPCEPCLPYD